MPVIEQIHSATEVNRIVSRLWPKVHAKMVSERLRFINEHHGNRVADLAIRVSLGEIAEGVGTPESNVHDAVRGELPEQYSNTYFGHLDDTLQKTYIRAIAIAREILKLECTLNDTPLSDADHKKTRTVEELFSIKDDGVELAPAANRAVEPLEEDAGIVLALDDTPAEPVVSSWIGEDEPSPTAADLLKEANDHSSRT